jgi:hypothetical protein
MLLPIWFSPARIKMVRDVTDEQRRSRPIFNATLWAGAGWLFFCVARSAHMIQIGRFARPLKNSQLTPGKIDVISGTGRQACALPAGLTPVVLNLRIRTMGDKSPKATHKHAAQKQVKAATASQKKNSAASAKQVPKTKK